MNAYKFYKGIKIMNILCIHNFNSFVKFAVQFSIDYHKVSL